MKLLDKLKNALFEEEYVEIEEKPKKPKVDKYKKEKSKKELTPRDERITSEEKPIAKRIIPQEKKPEKVDEVSKPVETIRDNDLVKPREEPRFTIVTDDDLKSDNISYQQPETNSDKKRRSDIEREPIVEPRKNPAPKLYQAGKTESYLDSYTPHEYGKYEKKKEKEVFKPSPIISPIYGIVSEKGTSEKDTRPEIRLTTSISHDKMDLDEIRRKAFGESIDNTLSDIKENDSETEDTGLLLDLSDDTKTPEVNSITMGDAEEYFEDLGLEYNEDYIDASKTTTRVEKNANLESPRGEIETDDDDNTIIIKEKKEETLSQEDSQNDKDNTNLFDLIDSMYE